MKEAKGEKGEEETRECPDEATPNNLSAKLFYKITDASLDYT